MLKSNVRLQKLPKLARYNVRSPTDDGPAHIPLDDVFRDEAPATIYVGKNGPVPSSHAKSHLIRATRLGHPSSRLALHKLVHASLRASKHQEAAHLILNDNRGPLFVSQSHRIHPTTLAKVMHELIASVPRRQTPQQWYRTQVNPSILQFSAEMVSHPDLRLASALHLYARDRLVPRSPLVSKLLWQALLNQRDWIAAAHMFGLQVRDYHARRTLPTVLRNAEKAGLSSHVVSGLRRKLAVLNAEDASVSRPFFGQLCYRLSGVLFHINGRLRSSSATANSEKVVPTDTGTKALTPARAKHHQRMVLQALVILSTMVDQRQVPFADVSAWINAAGMVGITSLLFAAYADPCQIPLSASADMCFHVNPQNARATPVSARAYMRQVLENYASNLPRTPHLCSQVLPSRAGSVWRGLHHQLETSSKQRMPPQDPNDASDDTFMAPPNLPTYEALLRVFLHRGEERGLYEESAHDIESVQDSESSEDWHYHAPRSPNNSDPLNQYPEHLLDFDAYPTRPAGQELSSKNSHTVQRQGDLAAAVLQHMIFERSPQLAPWQSDIIRDLLRWRSRDLENGLIGQDLLQVYRDGAADFDRRKAVMSAAAQGAMYDVDDSYGD
ncbi:unnamed protein product [Mycena citricolor]|uniref:Uncharacterized protein n=1 Tax=Mycena citricolor TaxID=2018698 RepID=A0AAD2HCP7_9AGAR|nr:unnamed protein product [Mycena citricolor]